MTKLQRIEAWLTMWWESLLWYLGFFFMALYVYIPNYWRSVWYDKWAFVVALSVIFALLKLRDRFHWSGLLLVAYLASSALWSFGWRTAYDGEPVVLMGIGKVTAYTLASLLALSFFSLCCEETDYKRLFNIFGWVCFVNSVVIIAEALCGLPAMARGGLFGNPSMSASIVAFSWPFALRLGARGRTGFIIPLLNVLLPPIACVLTGAAQPTGVLIVVMLAIWFKGTQSFKSIWRIGLFGALLFVCLHFTSFKDNHAILEDEGRFHAWKLGLRWWWDYGHHWTGQGTGITQLFLPLIERVQFITHGTQGASIDWWLWFHSDWLQTLFEGGYIGLILALNMYGFALYLSFKKAPRLFPVVIGLGASAVFNFPVHWPWSALIGMTTLSYILRTREIPS